MNKHVALDLDGVQVIGGPSTGWAWTDAYRQRKCPRCGSDPGFHCETPGGRRCWPPHRERVVIGPEHEVQAISCGDLSRILKGT